MTNKGMKLLCEAIVKQGVADYMDLKKKGVSKVESKYFGDYSKQEIEDFFRSRYGDRVVRHGLREDISGIAVLREIKAKYIDLRGV